VEEAPSLESLLETNWVHTPIHVCRQCKDRDPDWDRVGREVENRRKEEAMRVEAELQQKRRAELWARIVDKPKRFSSLWPGARVTPVDDTVIDTVDDICDAGAEEIQKTHGHEANYGDDDLVLESGWQQDILGPSTHAQLAEQLVSEYDQNRTGAPLTFQEYTETVYNVLLRTSKGLDGASQEKFTVEPKDLVCGEFAHAAKGFYRLLNVSEDEIAQLALSGVAAIVKEVSELGDRDVIEQLDYILWQTAEEKMFPIGMRDKGHAGMRLEDFVNHEHSLSVGLQEAEVVALRLYTTSAFKQINGPLRDQERISSGKPHPLPVTVSLITRGIKKLRAINADSEDAVRSKVLWRGMRNVKPTDLFASKGGTELAPMSTTTDIKTAVSYSVSEESLIFRIVTANRLQCGADLHWLSAFPAEAEILYPPLTYLQPTGRTQVLEINNCRLTIVEVIPTVA
jgi:hypothetical protein